MAVTNSPPRPSSAQSFIANFSGLFSFSDISHSTWSTKDVLPTCMFNFIITRWSHWSSKIVSCGNASICCLIACAIAGTNVNGFKSKSSHSTSANCSGVMRLSVKQKNLIYQSSFYYWTLYYPQIHTVFIPSESVP